MSKTKSKINRITKARTNKLRSARVKNIKNIFPECNILSQFKISDENIMNFKRHIKSPMDCVINALQLMGILDTLSSNMLRISCVGTNGFQKDQIEKLFILYIGLNFEFKATNDFDDLLNTIDTQLLPGHVVFAGYSLKGSSGHVFIIGRYLNGQLVYIDPQINTICDILECQELIKDEGKQYFILFNSEEKLTNPQLEYLGFTL
jgi:hypothetical protein